MYELIRAGEKSNYIESPAKIGIFLSDNSDVYLIDSGNDKDAGRKVRKILDENGWNLKAIINTHSHADHIGGNHYLQTQTNCKIFANRAETAFTRYPILEPSFLYGGYPSRDLRHKFLLAAESDVLDISDNAFPKELIAIPLAGHSFDMIGIRTPDDTVFLADCISSISTLEKYQISFIYDVEAYLETLNRVEAMEAAIFVPAHTEPMRDIRELVQINRNKVYEVADKIYTMCKSPLDFEEILRKVFDEYALTMDFEQYVLVGSTVKSYLSWMKNAGRVQAVIQNNRLLWQNI